MRGVRRWREPTGERGAMAILLCVVMVAVAVPVSAFAVTQVVRNGMQGELQRSADQGALAGSAMIPLADPTTLKNVVASLPTGIGSTAALIPSSFCTKGPAENGSSVSSTSAGGTCPLDTACKTALTSLQTDTALGKHYATPYGAPTCTATYTDDSSFFSQLTSCVSNVPSNLLSLAPGVPPTLTAILTPILNTLTGMVAGLVSTTSPLALGSILPALLEPGVSVTVSWQQRGPLDALTPGDNGGTHTMSRTASAKRAFKNVVVVPTVGVAGTVTAALNLALGLLGISVPKNAPTVGSGTTIDLNPALVGVASTLRTTLSSLDSIVGNLLPSCAGIVGSLSTDLADIIDPQSSGAPSAAQVISDAQANASPLFALMLPTQITSGLQIPFLDFVPLCLAQGSSVNAIVQTIGSSSSAAGSMVGCTLAAPGLFRGRLTS